MATGEFGSIVISCLKDKVVVHLLRMLHGSFVIKVMKGII